MNLDKAIEILTTHDPTLKPRLYPDYLDALKLGIEALKIFQLSRRAGWYPPGYKLQGETED